MSQADDDDDNANRERRVRDVLEKARTVDLGRDGPAAAARFDVEEFNERYAVVIIGGRFVVLDENWKVLGRDRTPVHERIRFLTPDAFERWHANRIFVAGEKQWTAAQLWMRHADRRQYQGLTFDPSRPPGGADVGGYYNLWQGYTVEPDPRATCQIFLDHIRTNVANGNEGYANFIFGTLADMFQSPTDRKGIALVLRGRQGTGKTVVGKHVGKLIEGNYALVDDPRYIVGNFNSHLVSVLLIQADEGFWAGDKQAEGRLKGLITSDRQMIEMKGKDPIQVPNYVRLLVTSNHSWVAPAGYEERRFAVFDVGELCMQNHEYFANMAAELADGGYGALLHLLQTFDTRPIELRRVPHTSALFEQKIASLSPEDSWWFTSLSRGWIVISDQISTGSDPEPALETWPTEIEIERVHRSYVAHCDQAGVRHKKISAQLGNDLRKLVAGLERGRATISGRRPYVYRLPSLEVCRAEFERRIGTRIDWEAGQPLSTPSIDPEDA